jgi:1,4-dihydroxy-2-naphthoate polyprenyltransferase
MKIWLSAFRLRTLPLALSSIGMGSFLALSSGYFSWPIFIFCTLTTVFLQILSNLANDYGDTVNGADSVDRKGPQRAVQSGTITLVAMKRAIGFFVLLSLLSGMYLLYLSFGFDVQAFFFFFLLGLMAIFAAVTYTAGRKPYGYLGLGDLSVLIFFGIIGVMGSYYLFAQSYSLILLLPALSCGLFSVAVLNLNNIRDIESDKKAGKFSIPVRIGRKAAVRYHIFLLLGGMLAATVYVLLNFHTWFQFTYLLILPLLIINIRAVNSKFEARDLDPYLKQMAITTLVFVLLFGIGHTI